jgi:hypothetical protein
MEAKFKVKLESLEPYRRLFPEALAADKTVKMGAGVMDTVAFIPTIIRSTTWQVQKFVDQELQGLSVYEACKKLWNFVKYHIEYRPDERGLEQVRSPRRLIHDGFGDCDCGTTFIGACLFTLEIPFLLRITKYKKDHFQHIYPVVLDKGKEITVDFVVHAFNYEEPYSEKKDFKMDLQYLDGIGEINANLLGEEKLLGDLGKLLKKNKGGGGGGKPAKKPLFKKPLFKKKAQTPEQKQKKAEKKKERGKKLLKIVNKVNKFNPATALLRGGLLASMKLNLLKVAEKLKWGYASRELAQSKGMDMTKYDKIKSVLAKTEKIFYGAGGKPENLRKAILTGHGNRNHEVVGTDGLDGLGINTPMSELLGSIYQDEFVTGMEGFEGFEGVEGLGEPATAAAITAASGAMATLAALLKSVGPLFPAKDKSGEPKQKKGLFKKKNKGGDQSEGGGTEESENAEQSEAPAESEQSERGESQEQSEPSEEEGTGESGENLPAPIEENLPATSDEDSHESSEETPAEEPAEESTEGLAGIGTGIKNFYEKNKKWLVPVGILAATATTVLIINHYANKPQPKPQLTTQPATVNGVPKKRRRRSRKGGGGNYGKQSVIALM